MTPPNTIGARVTITCTDATYNGRSGTIEYVYQHKGRDIIGVILDGSHSVTQFAPAEISKEA